MTAPWTLLHVLTLLLLPPVLIGVINRTRALWSGRRGPGVLQTFFDLVRLVRKQPVYSATTTELFKLGPLVMLASVFVSGLLVPLFGGRAPISFPYDFVALAYLWGLGRIFVIFGALDTGSAFEGMGASREATWGALIEPSLFLALGALAFVTGHTSIADLLQFDHATPTLWLVRAACAACFLIVLQLEASRVPIDDPATHLELTMIHEVMVLDHGGPELAALQVASGLKLLICSALIAALVNPAPGVATSLGLVFLIGTAVAFIESLTARLKLSVVPKYLALAGAFAFFALLAGAWEVALR